MGALAFVIVLGIVKELKTERLRAASDALNNQKLCNRVLIDETRTEGISYMEKKIQC